VRQWQARCCALRTWAVAHPREYALLYGSPVPGYAAPQDTVDPATASTPRWPPPRDDHPKRRPVARRAVLAAMAPHGRGPRAPAPPGSRRAPPRAWATLFGLVSLELFGHTHTWSPTMTPSSPIRWPPRRRPRL